MVNAMGSCRSGRRPGPGSAVHIGLKTGTNRLPRIGPGIRRPGASVWARRSPTWLAQSSLRSPRQAPGRDDSGIGSTNGARIGDTGIFGRPAARRRGAGTESETRVRGDPRARRDLPWARTQDRRRVPRDIRRLHLAKRISRERPRRDDPARRVLRALRRVRRQSAARRAVLAPFAPWPAASPPVRLEGTNGGGLGTLHNFQRAADALASGQGRPLRLDRRAVPTRRRTRAQARSHSRPYI